MIRKVSAEDIAIRGNGTGLEYMCPTWHFVYIFFNPVFQVSTAKNEINLFNNHILIVAPVTFAPAGAMTPSAEFLLKTTDNISFKNYSLYNHIATENQNASGGSSILVKSNIPHRQIDINSNLIPTLNPASVNTQMSICLGKTNSK